MDASTNKKKSHFIAYILVNKRLRSSVEDVRMLRGAAGTSEYENESADLMIWYENFPYI